MERITTAAEMQGWADDQRARRCRIGLVPTMGYLHEGHLRLIAESRRRADRTVVSLFVNPLQFGPKEDLASYPRDFNRDSSLACGAGADVLFAPEAEAIYPAGFQTHVEVENTARGLCGAFRPGHFRGVTTVVTKLFHLTRPHLAVFGEKDFQQLAVIRRLVRDLDFGIEIVGVPTVREADGLALSSRNTYLSPEERRAALCIPRALAAARALAENGERNAARILAETRRLFDDEPAVDVEYASLVDPETIEEVVTVKGPTRLAIAVRVGKTRLIDNCALGRTSGAEIGSGSPSGCRRSTENAGSRRGA